MTKREWLRSQGFQVGERGRLTPAMITALSDYPGEDNKLIPLSIEMVIHEPQYVKVDSPLTRPSRILYGITKDGTKVGFTICRACEKHMSICSCQDGVLSPIMVVSSKDKDVRVK